MKPQRGIWSEYTSFSPPPHSLLLPPSLLESFLTELKKEEEELALFTKVNAHF